MGRKHRIDPENGWHHVMSRGVDRQPIYFSDEDRVVFGEFLGEMVRRHGVEVHAYCLMTNHFHLLVRCPEGGLSEAAQYLLSMYATHVNKVHDRVGHLFGGRYASRLITSDRYLTNVVRYIHLNPLDIRGVRLPGEYRWSSHRTYLQRRPAPTWFTTTIVASWFPDPVDFDRFVCSSIGADTRAQQIELPPCDELIEVIDLAISESCDVRSRARMAYRRAVALMIAEGSSVEHRERILQELGIASAGARRTARHRARQQALDPSVEAISARVRQLCLADGVWRAA